MTLQKNPLSEQRPAGNGAEVVDAVLTASRACLERPETPSTNGDREEVGTPNRIRGSRPMPLSRAGAVVEVDEAVASSVAVVVREVEEAVGLREVRND